MIWVGVDGQTAGMISFTGAVKDGSAAAIARLKDLGLGPILLTGSNAAVAAIAAADLTVMGNDLGQVVQVIELSRRTLAAVKTNLVWAFFYNALGIPVAALGLLNPMIAGVAMAASSILVVSSSLRLRRFAATTLQGPLESKATLPVPARQA